MVNCKIELENNQRAVYYAGELLKGTIELFLPEAKKFRGFYFVVYGAAKCHWTESRTVSSGSGRNRTTRTQTTHYNGKDVYLNARTYLFGADGADAITMPSGTHRFDFACQLPPLLPASFEGSKGNIRYKVEACLDVPWGFDKEFDLSFTVVRNDDLNLQPELKIPSQGEEITRFCCLFCESEPLLMTVSIPFSGYAPGQNINVTVTYNNKSDVEVQHTRICLKRTVEFHSSTPSHKVKTETEKMIEMFANGVAAGQSCRIDKTLNVPRVMVCTNTQYCKVVQIFYTLKVEAAVPGCHGNVEIVFPITIGSTPLNFDPIPTILPTAPLEFSLNGHLTTNVPSVQPVMIMPPMVKPQVPIADQPPPSFEEAIKMKKHKEESESHLSNVSNSEAPTAPLE